jgi:TolA-binding protein
MSRFDELHALVDRHRGEVPKGAIASGRSAFIDAVGKTPTRPSMFHAWSLAAAMLAVVLGLSGYWFTRSRKSELAASASHVGGSSSVRLELPAEGPASLELTEGVTAELSAGTLAYRTEQAKGEHRVTLERGRLRLSIDPGRHTHWTVLVGGYEVSVVGTIFSVERLLDGAEIEVKVERGRVSVSGGSLGSEHVMVDAGHELRGTPAGFAVTDIPSASSPTPASEGSGVVEIERNPAAPSPAIDDGAFIARYRMRDYRGALEAAERSGFTGLLERLDRKPLAQLADAARLAGNVARARQALTRMRERFAGSTEAADAAFLLGRLFADSLSDPAGAARYFDLYLAERRDGAYADEAEGRSMVTHREAGDMARARQVASHYLARFPSGPYASTARSILR